MSNNQAGKGDKPRPIIKAVYDKNFDQIKWKNIKAKSQFKLKNKTTYKY